MIRVFTPSLLCHWWPGHRSRRSPRRRRDSGSCSNLNVPGDRDGAGSDGACHVTVTQPAAGRTGGMNSPARTATSGPTASGRSCFSNFLGCDRGTGTQAGPARPVAAGSGCQCHSSASAGVSESCATVAEVVRLRAALATMAVTEDRAVPRPGGCNDSSGTGVAVALIGQNRCRCGNSGNRASSLLQGNFIVNSTNRRPLN